jgi:hypothetical protein
VGIPPQATENTAMDHLTDLETIWDAVPEEERLEEHETAHANLHAMLSAHADVRLFAASALRKSAENARKWAAECIFDFDREAALATAQKLESAANLLHPEET